jgi:CheY-like chemotaxis protein
MTEPPAPLILIVDDYDDAREMYSEYLVYRGFRVVEALDGVQALEQAQTRQPDLILMDLSLPGMDGWEATRRLKADPRTAWIPVVALTGHALDGAAESAAAAGCDAFVVKPCTPDDLVAKMWEVLQLSRAD